MKNYAKSSAHKNLPRLGKTGKTAYRTPSTFKQRQGLKIKKMKYSKGSPMALTRSKDR